RTLDKKLDIAIEVRDLQVLKEVIDHGGIEGILLDNFDLVLLKEAVRLVDGRLITEASGGITIENAHNYDLCGVDYISMGALTHSVKSLDISLKSDAEKPVDK